MSDEYILIVLLANIIDKNFLNQDQVYVQMDELRLVLINIRIKFNSLNRKKLSTCIFMLIVFVILEVCSTFLSKIFIDKVFNLSNVTCAFCLSIYLSYLNVYTQLPINWWEVYCSSSISCWFLRGWMCMKTFFLARALIHLNES